MYGYENSPGVLMARTAILGVTLLAAICLASAAHPQTYSDDLARRLIERSDLQYDRVREFERMFRLYQVPPSGNVWQFDDIPTEGRAVEPGQQ
jgi:hypothetical protein